MEEKLSIATKIKEKARELGFHKVGFAAAEPPHRFNFYQQWVDAGYLGEMKYLKDHEPKKADPKTIFPLAKSIIICVISYKTTYSNVASVDAGPVAEITPASKASAGGPISAPPASLKFSSGIISNYAWGDDYHDVLREKLELLLTYIQTLVPEAQGKTYVDTGPLLERSYAEKAGIGWVGKNTCIIDQHYGSYLFLGEILINLDLPSDAAQTDHCGTCTRCLDACPTTALLEPYKLDATKCISYLTIEKKGDFSSEEKSMIGNHIFGCDICQEVCPWNHKSLIPDLDCFKPRSGNFLPSLENLNSMTKEDFQKQFSKSPIKRAKYEGFMRNVKVVSKSI